MRCHACTFSSSHIQDQETRRTPCIWQVEVLSIQHKMNLPPAFLSVYAHRAITQIEFSKYVVIGHMNLTLWTAVRALDRVARIVSIQKHGVQSVSSTIVRNLGINSV